MDSPPAFFFNATDNDADPARPRREGNASDVQTELLLRVRRARRACALARVDEPTLLFFVRATLQAQGASRVAPRCRVARRRGLRLRSDDEAVAPAARRRTRDFELSADTG